MFSRQHLLTVATESADGEPLHATVRALAADPAARVLVVVPAGRGAGTRLVECIAALEDLGLDVEGRLGARDPFKAVADALVTFPATELVVATDLAEPMLGRFGLPTVHVVAARRLVAA